MLAVVDVAVIYNVSNGPALLLIFISPRYFLII